MGISMNQYLSLSLAKEVDLSLYPAINLLAIVESIDNSLSVLLYSQSRIQYTVEAEHVAFLNAIIEKSSINNRSIQQQLITFFSKDFPLELKKGLLRSIMKKVKNYYQQESLTEVESYAFTIYTRCILDVIKSFILLFNDASILCDLFDIIELSEKRTCLLSGEDEAFVTNDITQIITNFVLTMQAISFTPESIESAVNHFFSTSSWIKKCFYLTVLTRAAIQGDYKLSQVKEIIKSSLLSTNSILYKITIRFFTLYVSEFCEVLNELPVEEQTQVLHFFLRHSFSKVSSVISSNMQDAYSPELKEMLAQVVSITASIRLSDFPSIQQSIANSCRYHVWLFKVLVYEQSDL